MNAAASGSDRSRPGEEGKLRILAAAFLIAVLLHFLPMFIFTPVKSVPEKEQTDRRFTVMLNKEPSAQYDPFDLYYWLKFGDPTLFAKPDYDSGFSASQKIRKSPLEADDAPAPMQLSLTTQTAFPENHYDFIPRSMGTLLQPLALRMPFPLTLPETGTRERKQTFPKWTAADGTDLGNLFSDQEKIRSLVIKNKPERSTVLLLSRGTTPEMPPMIKVGRSSGSPELDMRASGALAAYAGRTENAALPEKLKYIIVDWGTAGRGRSSQK